MPLAVGHKLLSGSSIKSLISPPAVPQIECCSDTEAFRQIRTR
jgi:hypothetical protein